MLWWAVALLAAVPGLAQGAGAGITRLTNAVQLHALSRLDASLGLSVRLTGVVTFFDPAWGILFVQDASGGYYVAPTAGLKLTAGQVVEITGRTDAGGVRPIVIDPTIRTFGEAPLPEPRRNLPPVSDFLSLDCQWTEIEGVVRSATVVDRATASDHCLLELRTPGWSWNVHCPTAPAELARYTGLVDARISVRGAAAMETDEAGRLAVAKLFVPGLDQLRVLTPPPADPFACPLRTIAQVQGEKASALPEHRVRVRGVVTYVAPDGEIVVEDATGAIRARGLRPGEAALDRSVEVVGFVTPGLFVYALEAATARLVSAVSAGLPPPMAAARLLYGHQDGRLARLDATVQALNVQSNGVVLTLHQQGIFFRALAGFPGATNLLSRLSAGSGVRLTGVCALQGQNRNEPQSFQILLRSERDLEPRPAPPVFSLRQVLALAGASLAVVAAGVIWLLTLRAQVKEQTQVIRQKLEREAALEQRYRHLLEGAAFPLLICSLEKGALLFLNQRAQGLLGLGPSAIGAIHVSGLFSSPRDWETLRAQLRLKPLAGEGELQLQPVAGQPFWALISANLIEFERQPAALISLNDISDRKAAETERERLIGELRDALARVKTLDGLLPICAGCKKIRNDQGYWASVESYIEAHSEAQFTHGLCPDCIPKYFPDVPKEDLPAQ